MYSCTSPGHGSVALGWLRRESVMSDLKKLMVAISDGKCGNESEHLLPVQRVWGLILASVPALPKEIQHFHTDSTGNLFAIANMFPSLLSGIGVCSLVYWVQKS